jgi:hypothetical protein
MQYHEVRNYGFNHIVRQYANFPWYLPLPVHTEHGWTEHTEALKSDLDTDKPLMLVFSERRATAWKKKSDIPVAIMGSPFIHYRNICGISKKKDAKGTVVFVTHSTFDIKCEFNILEFCKELKKLPRQYHPVRICLFYLDFIDKKADIYRRMGFEVVSAGPKFVNSLEFARKFYEILSAHKYAASNALGSYAFYAVDLGIAFFLIGHRPKLINQGGKDVNLPAGRRDTEFYRRSYRLFSTGPTDKISKKQADFVAKEMGVGDCLSGKELGLLLRKYYKKNNYYKLIIPHLLALALHAVIFNVPWTGWAMFVRNKLGSSNG